MSRQTGSFSEWMVPLAFVICGAWVVWHGPAYIMAMGGHTDALAARYPEVTLLDWIALAACPLLFIAGCLTLRHARMEYPHRGPLDNVALFVGRVTMLLIVILVCVMIYEVFVRYVLERPTLWANELSLWLAGFVFVLAGLYAMQQRSHIRIFILYDMFPRWLQRVCDTISVALIVLFALALIYGGWGEAQAKFMRWETFGTAFDPPIPATEKPLILIAVSLVAIQAVLNLIRDWNLEPEIHTDEPDEEEIEALKRAVGVEGTGDLDVTRGPLQNSRAD
jgi:TRAP-type mannitol/chloroaromatic compound transport system permease small subunit